MDVFEQSVTLKNSLQIIEHHPIPIITGVTLAGG